MDHLKIAISTWDIQKKHSSFGDLSQSLISHINSLAQNSQIILLPEYAPCELLGSSHKEQKAHSHFIWELLAPELKKLSKKTDTLIVAGTAPFIKHKKIYNRALCYASGKEYTGSKIALTPWEKEFHSGKKPLILEWKKLKIALLICLDVEMPELSHYLKKKKIDLLLVPSATSDQLGSSRVHRCASARAIELGVPVAVSPLLGFSPSHPLVDINTGYPELYLPSQNAFATEKQSEMIQNLESGVHVKYFVYEKKVFKKLHSIDDQETKPFLTKIKL